MPPHPEELKNHDRETKCIVIVSPYDCFETLSVEFGRCVFGNAHDTRKTNLASKI
jgi:hypothetical protein